MKIDDKILNYEINQRASQTAQNITEKVDRKIADETRPAQSQATEQDTIVDLSPALKETQAIKDIIATEPDIRTEKVADLQNQIESGQYQVNHQAVAAKVVEAFMEDVI